MTQQMATGRLQIDHTSEGHNHTASFVGQIDERSNLVEFVSRYDHGTLRIDLNAVSFINSVGVREWIRMLRALSERGIEVHLARCSEAMIHQINMIVEAKGKARVESFFAPYSCEHCGHESSECIDVEPNLTTLRRMDAPEMKCPECGKTMSFNEIPERYFLFLG